MDIFPRWAGSRDAFSRAELLTYYETPPATLRRTIGSLHFRRCGKEIERRLRAEHADETHQQVMQKLRAKASVVTMFGDAAEASTAAADPQEGNRRCRSTTVLEPVLTATQA